jgi:hypothetical protein
MAKLVRGDGRDSHCTAEFRIRHDDNRGELHYRFGFVAASPCRMIGYSQGALH